MKTLKLGELCAGYGGLGLAVEEALGAELAWYSEFDAAPSKIMATHWPEIPNHGDMTQIDWTKVSLVDIISGGTPCQDLSNAGRRKGMTEGTRSNLWVNMREAIATIKPKYVAWENVRGAYSAKADSDLEFCPGCMGAGGGAGECVLRALGRVLGDLSDLGYDTQWRGLRAADVGAPHGRFRVFVLATRRDQEPSDPNDAGLEGQCDSDGATPTERHRHLGPGTDAGDPTAGHPSVRGRDEARLAGPREHQERERPGAFGGSGQPATPNRPRSTWDGTQPDDLGTTSGPATKPGERAGAVANADCGHDAGREQDQKRGAVERTPAERIGGDVHGSDGIDWGDYAPAIRRWEAVRGTAPAPTELTAKGKHRLSARFAEWMMGIPAGWVTDVDISRNEQLKAIGNGVVPQQAVAAIRDMLAYSCPMEVGIAA